MGSWPRWQLLAAQACGPELISPIPVCLKVGQYSSVTPILGRQRQADSEAHWPGRAAELVNSGYSEKFWFKNKFKKDQE